MDENTGLVISDDEDDGPFSGGVSLNLGAFTTAQVGTADSAVVRQNSAMVAEQPAPTHVKEPEHQPLEPPTQEAMVTLENFARFIKRHASPPHHRVTAGGRIVPVGPQSPPPTFHMEFIDRVLQATEQVKHDTSPDRKKRFEEWLLATPLDGTEKTDNDKPKDMAHAKDDDASTVCSSIVSQARSSAPLAVHEHSAGTFKIPEVFKIIADMNDKSKIVRTGTVYYRAYINKDGATAFERMFDSKDVKQTPIQQTAEIARVTVVQDAPLSAAGTGLGTVTPGQLVFIPNPSTGEYRQMIVTYDSTGDLVYVPYKPKATANAVQSVGSIAATPMAPGLSSSIMPTPAVTVLSYTMPSEYEGQSRQQIEEAFIKHKELYDRRAYHLHTIEKMLAKEEHLMGPLTRQETLSKKRELIVSTDQARKEMEKAMQGLQSLNVQSGLGQQNPGNTYGWSHPVLDGIQHHAMMYVPPPPPPFPPHIPPLSMSTTSAGVSAISQMYNPYLKADVPEFIPSTTTSTVRPLQPLASPAAEAVPEAECASETVYKSALIRLPTEDTSSATEADQSFATQAPRQPLQTATKVTLRRPDGTPLDLSSIAKRRGRAKSHFDLRSSATVQRKGVQFATPSFSSIDEESDAARSPVRSLSPMKSSYATGSSRSDGLVKAASSVITWSRQPNETKEAFDRRCEKQREFLSKCEDRDKRSIVAQKVGLAPGIYSDENQIFRRQPLQVMNPKGPQANPAAAAQHAQSDMVQHPIHPYMAVQTPHIKQGSYSSNMTIPTQKRPPGPTMHNLSSIASQLNLNPHSGAMVVHPEAESIAGAYTASDQAVEMSQGHHGPRRTHHYARPSQQF